MPRFKTGNALTAAEKQKRYRERLENKDRENAALEQVARHIAFSLREFAGEKLELVIPDNEGDATHFLMQLQNSINEKRSERRYLENMERQEQRQGLRQRRGDVSGDIQTARGTQ